MEKFLVDRTAEFDSADIEANKVVCGISYLWILFFLPLVACKESRVGKFHANQALLLLLYSVASGILGVVLAFIPIIGAILSGVIGLAGTVAFFYCIINTFMGKCKEVPLIGKLTLIKY